MRYERWVNQSYTISLQLQFSWHFFILDTRNNVLCCQCCHSSTCLNGGWPNMWKQNTILQPMKKVIALLLWWIKKYISGDYLVSGWSVGNGSGVITSNPAIDMVWFCKASTKSSWLTIPPRLVLMNTAEFFMDSNAFLSNRCWVSLVSAQVAMTKSDLASRPSKSEYSAPFSTSKRTGG